MWINLLSHQALLHIHEYHDKFVNLDPSHFPFMIVLSISVNNIYENIPDPAYVYMCQVAMCRENWYLIVTFLYLFIQLNISNSVCILLGVLLVRHVGYIRPIKTVPASPNDHKIGSFYTFNMELLSKQM